VTTTLALVPVHTLTPTSVELTPRPALYGWWYFCTQQEATAVA
jgi:hypothetical protein